MSETFSSVVKDIESLKSRYFHARSAFYIFETLKKLKSPPHAGKNKVVENVKVMNNFINFFTTIEESNRFYFFVELAKFFDGDSRTLTIKKILEGIEKNIDKLTKEAFLEYLESINRPINPYVHKYTGISKKDISLIKRSLLNIKPITDKIWEYRSTWLAHDDINKKNWPINRKELKKVFDVIEKILNKLSNKIDWSTTSYKFVMKECEKETKLLVKYLIEYKKIRLKKIEKQREYNL